LYYPQEEEETAAILEKACIRSHSLIREMWGLEEPEECRLYVMTSWLPFIFHSAPWHVRVYNALSLPLWYFRIRKSWKWVGGWTLRYSKRPAVGVKSLDLIKKADRSMGALIFIEETDLKKKVEHITCHEMAHAYSAHLKLPFWINEGIAMVTVDAYFGRQTIQSETIMSLNHQRRRAMLSYRNLYTTGKEDLVHGYVRGYWITRFLMDTNPGVLREVMKKKKSHRAIQKKIASALGISRRAFWGEIDGLVFSHFKEKAEMTEQDTALNEDSVTI
jgi:hypothetical protein